MSLSWIETPDSIAVAITSSKQPKNNDKILYLSNSKSEEDPEKKSTGGILHEIERMVEYSDIHKKQSTTKKIYQAYVDDVPVTAFQDPIPKVVEIYKKIATRPINKMITLDDGVFEFLPLMPKYLKEGNYRQSIFVCGMAGSGKTWWVKKYVLLYHEAYPKNKIYFISQQDLDDDESLTEIRPFVKQITVAQLIGDKDAGEEPLQWTDVPKNSLVLFDDYDGFPDAKSKKEPSLKKIVHVLLDDLLRNGRKHYISVIASSHELNKTHKNETVMKEMEYFVLFPDGIMLYHLNYFGTKYLGISKDKVKQIKTNKSRWVMIRRRVPMFELTEHTAQIVK